MRSGLGTASRGVWQRARRWALQAALLLSGICCAAPRALAGEPGASLSISLLTMGPGEHPFTKFGHTALWVHDAESASDEVYNFGTFAFDSPTLLLDSVAGKLPYWLSVQSLQGTIATYRAQDRSLVASELSLTPPQRWALLRALQLNALPENRYYRYEYYRDNCSTRVRDALDRVIGGRLAQGSKQPVSMTYRDHTLRLVQDSGLLYAALDVALGPEADARIDRWDEGFLPAKLLELVHQARVPSAGQDQPLVQSERALVTVSRAEPASAAPSWGARYAVWGLGLGALFAAAGLLARARPAVRRALGAPFLLVGSAVGLLGSALAYLSLFSAHAAAHSNVNVLLFPPWAFALCVAGARLLRARPGARRASRLSALALLASVALSLLVNALLPTSQANARELAFAVPLWLGVLGASWLLGPD